MISKIDTDGCCDKCTCGGNVLMRSGHGDAYWCECDNCGKTTTLFDSENESVIAWNKMIRGE